MKTPITIINGPLGSGKTSLIYALLKNRPNSEQVLWLKTEFGTDSIDQYLLQETGVQTEDLVGGCICHVLLSDFDAVLEKVKTKNFNEVIVETSGMSHPAPVLTIIKQHTEFFIKHMALIVDSLGVENPKYPKPMPLPYGTISPYNSIVFNKYPQNLSASDEGALEKLLDPWYAGIYDSIEKVFISNDVENIKIDAWVSAMNNAPVSEFTASTPQKMHAFEDHEGENIETHSIYIAANHSVDTLLFEQLMNTAPENIIRIKGIIPTNAGTSMVFNWARGRGNWSTLNQTPDKFVLLIMGYDLATSQEFIDSAERILAT
jgi:G3E family GTPase